MTWGILTAVVATFLATVGATAIGAVIINRRLPFLLIYRSKQHLQWAFDSLSDPVAIIDSSYGLLRVNKAYATLVKRPFSEILGTKCFSALRGRASPCPDCRMAGVLESSTPELTDHSPHPVSPAPAAISISFFPFVAHEKHGPAVVEHIRDITTIEQLRKDLEEHNVVLQESTRVLERSRAQTSDELDLARQIQLGIMPQGIPVLRGAKIAATYHPIGEVGGDIYDFIPFSDTRLGIFVGDASGHGLASALVATISKMALYNHTREGLPVSNLLGEMNKDILRNIRTGHYLTCFWCTVDVGTRTLTYSRAGHPYPVIISRGKEVTRLAAGGMFLGILDQPSYESETVPIQPGDRLFIFTDGIFEMIDRRDTQDASALGYKDFVEILRSCNHVPFEKIIPAIQQQLSGLHCEDDYTLIVVEMTNEEKSDG